jgi:hypothetical protein
MQFESSFNSFHKKKSLNFSIISSLVPIITYLVLIRKVTISREKNRHFYCILRKVNTKSENNFSISFESIVNISLRNSYSVVESNYLLHLGLRLGSRENQKQVNDMNKGRRKYKNKTRINSHKYIIANKRKY